MITSKYYLENQTGARYGLNVDDEIIFCSVEGLGVAVDNELQDLENGFCDVAKVSTDLQQIVGNLMFRAPNAFANYQSLVNWMLGSTELYLIYQPFGDEYRRKVALSSIKKAQRKRSGWATDKVIFNCLTPWYKDTAVTLKFGGTTTDNMTYPYIYGGGKAYAVSAGGTYTAVIQPSGHIPAAIKLRYNGRIASPKITLTGVNTGKVYGSCAIDYSFESTSLEYSSSYTDAGAWGVNSAGERSASLLEYISIATEPFFRAPCTEPCELAITSPDALNGTVTATITHYYRSV